jgi:hypothetical protein
MQKCKNYAFFKDSSIVKINHKNKKSLRRLINFQARQQPFSLILFF